MSTLLVTPILFQYQFLDDLCLESANLLSLNSNDLTRYKQLKLSIFINFNRYLLDSMLFLPNDLTEDLLAKLVLPMKEANEAETILILKSNLIFFDELRSDFLDIIKTLKK